MFDSPPWPPTDPRTILACTIWMEARGDGLEGMHAVASVVLNRARNPRWWGEDIASVCLAPEQFSSWNHGSTQIPLVIDAITKNDLTYQTAYNLAEIAISGLLPDITGHADSYFRPTHTTPPDWAIPEYFTAQIGTQKFYRTELSPLVA